MRSGRSALSVDSRNSRYIGAMLLKSSASLSASSSENSSSSPSSLCVRQADFRSSHSRFSGFSSGYLLRL